MKLSGIAAACALAALLQVGVALKAVADQQEAAYRLAEHEDQLLLQRSWTKTEEDLSKLATAAEALLEYEKGEPKAAPKDAKASAPPVGAKAVASSKTSAVAASSTKPNAADQLRDLLGASGAGKGAMGKAMLVPALGMLKSLYEDQKTRIAEVNKREEQSKQRFEKQKAEHEKQLQRLKDLVKNHKVSDGLYQNSTKDADRMFSYWQRCRERNHHQFHTNLKLTHAMMDKVKHMIKAYEQALAEPTPTKAGAAEAAKLSHEVAPEIVLVQVMNFCTDMLKTVKKEVKDMSNSQVLREPVL